MRKRTADLSSRATRSSIRAVNEDDDDAQENAGPEARHRDSMLGAAFPSTQWSVVFKAQKDDAQSLEALDEICRRYWYPIYAYLRCRGFERQDAQDLTQSFFLRAINGGLIEHADPQRGKLRSYLLGALTRHIASHIRRENTEKRGGRAIVLPLEVETAEEKFSNEPVDHRDPEKIYLASWARSLIDTARQRLREHLSRKNQLALFDELQSVIEMDDDHTPYRALAARLDTSEAALRIQVFRLRRRFGKFLRDEVAKTVETPAEIEEELAWLASSVRGGP